MAPEVIVIQDTLVVAGRSQFDRLVVTLMEPVPPEGGKIWLVGLNVTTQAADWLTVNVAVPMLMVPLRLAPSGLAATAKVTLVAPLPEAAEVTVIQPAFDSACHEHESAVFRLNEPLPPAGLKLWLDGLTE